MQRHHTSSNAFLSAPPRVLTDPSLCSVTVFLLEAFSIPGVSKRRGVASSECWGDSRALRFCPGASGVKIQDR